MNRRLFILLGVVALLGLGVAVTATRGGGRVRFQGRPVRTWALLAESGNAQATAAFKDMGPKAVPELIQLLETGDAWPRRQLWALTRKLPPRPRSAVLKATGYPNALALPNAAARSLGIIGPEARAAIPALARVLRGNNHQLRWDAAAALWRIGKEAVPALTEALQSPDPDVLRAAAYALGEIGPDAAGAVPALIRLLESPNSEVRSAAANTLPRIVPPALASLRKVVEDGTADARGAAVQVLLEHQRALWLSTRALVKMAQAREPAVRRQALEALGTIRLPSTPALNALTAALLDPEPEVRVAAADALAQMWWKAQPAVSNLVACLDDASSPVRQAAARTLGAVGAPARLALPKLEQLQDDKEETVRNAAKEARARIEGN